MSLVLLIIFAVTALALAFAAAAGASKLPSRSARIACGWLWAVAVCFGLWISIFKIALNVPIYPWSWVTVGYVIVILFLPFAYTPNKAPTGQR